MSFREVQESFWDDLFQKMGDETLSDKANDMLGKCPCRTTRITIPGVTHLLIFLRYTRAGWRW